MPRHATKTSFRKGHKMPENVRINWLKAMVPIWEKSRGRTAHQWTDESKNKLSQSIKGLNHPRALPLFSERIDHSGGIPYTKIKINPSGRWPFKHRYLMEEHLKRKLSRREVVHHINGNSLDNRIENFRLLTPEIHNSTHFTITTWSKKYDQCQRCGTNKKRHIAHGLCSTCHNRDRAEKLGYWP